MKILIRNSDSAVMYAQEVISLTTSEASGVGWVDRNFNTDNARVVGAELPLYWTGAAFYYVDGVWGVLDQARYDKRVADVQAKIATAAVEAITTTTQSRLDDFAKTRNYDGILAACTYAASLIPKFAAEGQYAVSARDETWAALYTVMGEVQAGTRQMPTCYADVETLLPVLAWPI